MGIDLDQDEVSRTGNRDREDRVVVVPRAWRLGAHPQIRNSRARRREELVHRRERLAEELSC